MANVDGKGFCWGSHSTNFAEAEYPYKAHDGSTIVLKKGGGICPYCQRLLRTVAFPNFRFIRLPRHKPGD